jgi:TolB-like protein/Tfp pilus assembly protein PilF
VHPTQGLWLDGREIRITPKSLAVLCVLARRSRDVVTKAELFQQIWPDTVVTDAALSSCIRELRGALGDDARRPRFIETVHRRGFRLLVPAEGSFEEGSATCTAAAAESVESGPRSDPVSSSQPAIVVLPFETIGSEQSEGILARGLVHDVITRIARSRMMLVIARGTAFQFAAGPRDVRAIGRKLGVRYVVQGAVQATGTHIKVSVSLASALDEKELWSEQYQRKLDDFMLIQESIADSIIGALESAIQREEVRRSMLMPSGNLDAWSAYHRGLHHMYRFRHEDCDAAEQLFLRSAAMEPTVPRPYAGLSFISFERGFLNLDGNRSTHAQKASEYAQKSLSIDPLDPMGHWALSRAHLLRGELEESKESLETALELNPSYAIAQYSLGWVGLQLGDNELCLQRIAIARRLSPYDPLKFAMLGVSGLSFALMGRTAEAMQLALRSARSANAHHHVLAFTAVTLVLCGEIEDARRYFQRLLATVPGYGVDDFLASFPFRLERDLCRVRNAFELMQSRRNP